MNGYDFEFRGSMLEYALATLGWAVLLVITFGLATPFYIVWNFKWFVENLKMKEFKI